MRVTHESSVIDVLLGSGRPSTTSHSQAFVLAGLKKDDEINKDFIN